MKKQDAKLNWKQKILVNILKCLDNKKCSRLKLFKIAFLLSKKVSFYDFVPYQYGPYSFEMDKDLRMFNNNGWIKKEDNSIYPEQNSLNLLSVKTKQEDEIYQYINKFKNISEKKLIDFIYKNYPYYAQNSLLTIAHSKTSKETAPISIYTIGYQNLSIDLFINVLINKGIGTLLDVRNKPLSYKYGFNYYWLDKYLPKFGIKYINVPELGIEERYRATLSQEELWRHYLITLEKKEGYLKEVSDIISKQPTVLMCYEMKPEDCHRLILARKIKDLLNLSVINFDVNTNKWIQSNY